MTVYYVKANGNNSSNGTSIATAWQTLAKVNAVSFKGGDQVLLEGGATFPGNLFFDASDTGSDANPITVSAFGEGRANVLAGSQSGIYAYNTGGFVVSKINFRGDGKFSTTKHGISFYTDRPGNVKLPKVHILDCEATGFGGHGIRVGSWNERTGYRDIRIAGCNPHHNQMGGVSTSAAMRDAHEHVALANVIAHDNAGMAGQSKTTGSGIVLGHVNHASIERCEAYENGANSTSVGGPVGIWTYSSNDVLIQHNKSHHNHTNSTADGGGFDLDGGTTNSVLQYNYSHDNDGPGFLICQFAGAGPMLGNIIRHNVSRNDGRKNGYTGIALWSDPGLIGDTRIHNNTVFISPSGSTQPKAIRPLGRNFSNVLIYNNLLVTTGNLPSVWAAKGVSFNNNAYWANGGSYLFRWDGRNYSSLAAWQKISGQEKTQAAPANTDPQLVDPSILEGFALKSTSPFVGKDIGAAPFWAVS